MKKADVDKGLCISCGTCVSLCPDSFKFGEDGKSEFIENKESACDLESVAESCPTAAITVIEE